MLHGSSGSCPSFHATDYSSSGQTSRDHMPWLRLQSLTPLKCLPSLPRILCLDTLPPSKPNEARPRTEGEATHRGRGSTNFPFSSRLFSTILSIVSSPFLHSLLPRFDLSLLHREGDRGNLWRLRLPLMSVSPTLLFFQVFCVLVFFPFSFFLFFVGCF